MGLTGGGGNIVAAAAQHVPKRTLPGQPRRVRPGGGMNSSWLKSPLGDLRNKLFNDPTSPYFPSHPKSDDTITFNPG
jgi:hypothetical protein